MKNELDKEINELANLLSMTNELQNPYVISKINYTLDILKDYSKEQIISYLDELQQHNGCKLSEFEFLTFYRSIFLIKLCVFLKFDANDNNKFLEDCLKEFYKENKIKS